MVTMKEVLDYVETVVKQKSCLLQVWQVESDSIGQVNVKHPLSDNSYNVFQVHATKGRVRLDYIDSNFKPSLDSWLWDKLGQSLPH